MARRFKTFIFFFLIFVFLLAAPAVILYSQGYRFDFEQKRVVKTGGIFVKAEPKKAAIELDGRKIKETDLFFGSLLIDNVFPGDHQVQVSKEGYLPWRKRLLVQESKVTEAKEVKLIRDNITFKELSGQAQSIFIAPNLEQALLWEKDGSLKLYNFKTQVKSQLLDRKDFPITGPIEVLKADFSKDNSKILLQVSGREQLNFFLVELSLPPKLKRLSFIPGSAQDIFFDPLNSQKAILVIDGSFFNADLARNTFDSKPLLKDIASFTLKDEILYGLNNKGQLISYSFLSNALKVLSQDRLNLEKGDIFRDLKAQDSFLFFQQADTLRYLDLKKNADWRELSQNLTAFELSPDRKKIAFSKGHELWVLFLEEILTEPARKSGENVFITRLSKPIGKIIWINNNYLLLEAGGQLSITELDNRDSAQLWLIGNFSSPEIFFDPEVQQIYLKQNSSFSVSSPIF